MTQGSEFIKRRQRLMRRMGRDSVLLLGAAPERLRSGSTHYAYRQDSDFYYLTGFTEPEAILLLAPGHDDGDAQLFCRPHDRERERWEGARLGPDGAVAQLGFDSAWPIESLDQRLPGLLAGRHRLYYPLNRDAERDRILFLALEGLRRQVRAGVHAPEAIVSPQPLLHELRLRKSRAEIALMRRAARISARAHQRAMRACRPGATEFQLDAELLYEFVHGGCAAPAYPSIVAGGANACVLHYHSNHCELQGGDLVLIDAGGEYAHYAADITRTFPVNGRFSGEQRAAYEVVLAAQQAAIAAVRPGNDWNAPHQAALAVLCAGLVDLGILHGDPAELLAGEAYKPFYMHRTGHWLGLDVHDVGEYRIDDQWRPLEAGMTLTVEPALYFLPDTEGLDPRWWHIGIRIEDDIVVTRDGCEVLSREAPKEIGEIEAIMRERPRGRR